MKREAACMVFIFVFLTGIMSSFRIESARADSAIYINADGSIYPTTVPISTTDNVTYTLTGNISSSDGIIVERNNSIIDGNGYTVQGIRANDTTTNGFLLSDVNNVTIKDTVIRDFDFGIELNFSSHNTLSNNDVASRFDGVGLYYSFDNTVVNNNATSSQEYGFDLIHSSDNVFLNNNVANGQWGILLWYSSNNTWSGNNIIRNVEGIRLDDSFANKIFHNNFIKNRWQADDDWNNSMDTWDNGVEGNYWSDYNGTDSNQDGIGDTPYVIPSMIVEEYSDRYPLMGSFKSFNVLMPSRKLDEVGVISNSTVEKVELGINPEAEQYPYFLRLTVHGQNETDGFCRITFPNDLLNSASYPVYVAGYNATLSRIVASNDTQTTLYFTYSLPYSISNYYIDILPEFPFLLILSLFMAATLLATIAGRKRHLTRALKSLNESSETRSTHLYGCGLQLQATFQF